MKILKEERNYNDMDSVSAVLYTVLMNVDEPEYDLDDLFDRITRYGHFLQVGTDGVIYELDHDGSDYLTWHKLRQAKDYHNPK